MHGNDTRRRTDVALPLLRFALAGLLAVVVVGAIGVALQRNAARNDAIRDAKTLARLAGSERGLQSERDYTRRVLPAGVARGLGDLVGRGDLDGLRRSAAIVAGLATTVAGYAAGSALLERSARRRGFGPSRRR